MVVANPYRGEGELTIAGQTLLLKLSHEQYFAAEREMRKRLGVTLSGTGPAQWGHEGAVLLLWACLLHEDPDLTPEAVAERFFTPRNFSDILLAVAKVLASFNGLTEEEFDAEVSSEMERTLEDEAIKNA